MADIARKPEPRREGETGYAEPPDAAALRSWAAQHIIGYGGPKDSTWPAVALASAWRAWSAGGSHPSERIGRMTERSPLVLTFKMADRPEGELAPPFEPAAMLARTVVPCFVRAVAGVQIKRNESALERAAGYLEPALWGAWGTYRANREALERDRRRCLSIVASLREHRLDRRERDSLEVAARAVARLSDARGGVSPQAAWRQRAELAEVVEAELASRGHRWRDATCIRCGATTDEPLSRLPCSAARVDARTIGERAIARLTGVAPGTLHGRRVRT